MSFVSPAPDRTEAEAWVQAAPWHRAPRKWEGEADEAMERGDFAEAINVAQHAFEYAEGLDAQ